MIKCPDCGREISDELEKCPYCGCPIKRVSKSARPGAEGTGETVSEEDKKKDAEELDAFLDNL